MIKKIIYILIIFSCADVVGQQLQEHSVHKEHKEIFGKVRNIVQKNDRSISDIIPLQVREGKELSKIVFGYLPDWEYNNGSQGNLNYNLLTHIATFDFNVSSSGAVGLPSSWPWNDVINDAHNAGTKVIMTATNFDGDDINKIITDETSKQKFFSDTKNIIKTYQLDGVNVDFESLNNDDKGSNINVFMSELTEYIHSELPGKEVSFAGPAVNWGDRWDLDGLVQSCDMVFIMGYSFWGKWSSTSGPCAPLTGFSNDITSVVTEDYGVPLSKYPDKLILGVPYYGHEWKTETGNAYSNVIEDGYVSSTRFYNDIDNANIYGLLWDEVSQTSWFRWQEGDQWNQTWFDDVQSLGKKYDLAIAYNLGGVGMWALGYDGDKQDLWNLINYKFGSASLPIPNKPSGLRVIQYNSNTIVLSFEAVDYADKYGIYLSTDGTHFEKITESVSNSISLSNLTPDSIYYFKVDAINSAGSSTQTEVLAAIPSSQESKVLIVNGFDRTSGTNNTFDFIKMYDAPMKNMGLNFSSASNEAVYKSFVNLNDYNFVIWILMDESSTDETFNPLEQEKVKNYIDYNGALIVSGSEIGWDLVAKGSDADKAFYKDYLKAKYISDAPNNENATYYSVIDLDGTQYNFDDGTHGTIDVDWPDAIEAISGAENIYSYKNVSTSLGYAGIRYRQALNQAGGVVYLAFPIESVYDDVERMEILSYAFGSFDITPSVEVNDLFPNKFELFQNYPNPFNPSTTIKYSIPDVVDGHARTTTKVILKIFNILGQEIAILVNNEQSAGNYEVKFDASGLSSGTYIYRITAGKYSDSKKMILLR